MRPLPHVIAGTAAIAGLLVTLCATARGEPFDDFASVLQTRCVECHNPSGAKGGLDLTTRSGALRGGDSGPAIDSRDLGESLLLKRVFAGEMPPESQGQPQPLGERETTTVRAWFEDGGKWPEGRSVSLYGKTSKTRGGLDWWSLQPLKLPQDIEGDGNPIDMLIRRRLEEAGLRPAPPADRRTLLRRASLDLLGLPPTAEQVEQFVNDASPEAWSATVDRMLASPHYGERWARHWLDVVRFAETCGYERDQIKPNIWQYRDWVIGSLNDDMPYDRFVTLQLAGDEVPDRDASTVAATGMIRAGTWNDEPNDPADYQYDRLEDMIHATSSAFLALTVKCARCHNHKFDPVPQTDYYRMASFFWPGYIGQANLGGPSKDELGFDVFGWTDRGAAAPPVHLLYKGDRHRPGPEVKPGFLSAIPQLDAPLDPPPADSRTTHRRLQLAQWITHKQNPLTARVIANRLWLHHFGEGLVRTPNNFGYKGERPTHPELLDFLAHELMDPTVASVSASPWTLKRIHRLIMTSKTYQQSSLHPQRDSCREQDPQNQLWWRFNRRRLDAEALRDSLLAASGQLNKKMGGPSFYPAMSPEALEGLSRKQKAWQQSSLEARRRRSIYMMTKRSRLLPLMTAFDFRDTTLPCGRREVTTVAPQSLALMNNHFVHWQSESLARRCVDSVGDDPRRQIEAAWRFVLQRPPSEGEVADGLEHLESQRRHFEGHRDGAIVDLKIRDKLALWLRADRGVEIDDAGGVRFWRDAARIGGQHPHDGWQSDAAQRPRLTADAIHGRPAIRFDGKSHFMHLAGQVIWSQQFTIIAVIADRGTTRGPREVISNWHRRGRSTTSVFLGTVGKNGVRFTDAMAGGAVDDPARPFVLTASSGANSETFQNRRPMASTGPLARRDLHGPYVIGTQGNYGTEWWHGDIAEILVYDRALPPAERESVWSYLEQRYGLQHRDAKRLALESLCHVLLNTNEFIYVD